MECGICTVCCVLLNISEMKSPPGKACPKCVVGVGCRSYSQRPSECNLFDCAYQQMESANEKLRPDSCGVIFEKLSDALMLGVADTHDSISEIAFGQINAFAKQGFSVILKLIDEKNVKIVAALERKPQDVFDEYARIVEERHGRT